MENSADIALTGREVEFKAGAHLWFGAERSMWCVLDVDREQETALLIADAQAAEKPYHEKWESITWEKCTLRTWLNGEYYEKTFSDAEKAAILVTGHENPNNPQYGTAGGNPTTDRIFLLSIEEAERYFRDDKDRAAGRWWWLRSPGKYGNGAAYVYSDGGIHSRGYYVYFRYGIRPAFKINLKSDLFQSFIISQSDESIIIRVPELRIQERKVIRAAPDVENVKIPSGVTEIGEGAFRNCAGLKSVKIPESVTTIEKNAFSGCGELVNVSLPETAVNFRKRYFAECKKLEAVVIHSEKGQNVLAYSEKSDRCNLDDYGTPGFWNRYDIEIINNGPQFRYKAPARLLAAAGRLANPVELSETSREAYVSMLRENVRKVITLAEKHDVPEAVQVLFETGLIHEENRKKMKKLIAGSSNPGIAALASTEVRQEEQAEVRELTEAEREYGDKFEKAGGDRALREMRLAGKAFPEIIFQNGENAPESLLKFILVCYGKQAKADAVGFNEEADRAADLLTYDSLSAAIEQLSDHLDAVAYPAMLPLICRYGNAVQIRALLKTQKEWADWNRYGAKGRDAQKRLRELLNLSDTHEAVTWLEKNAGLGKFAELRGLSKAEVYDRYLFDFGFDDAGTKVYDLGTTAIEASLDKSLSITLLDTAKGKIVRSIPKKNIDPTVQKKAADDLADLRANLKKAVKIKTDRLFEDYISGRQIPAARWKKSYLPNPVLRSFAELLIWEQGGRFFVLKDSAAVDCTGAAYSFSEEPVRVAHTMDMGEEEIGLWQKYFSGNQLKQPFEQVWEPAYRENEIREDRYSGIPVRFKYLKNREKHGIEAGIYYTYEDITDYIHLTGCDITYTIEEYATNNSSYGDNRALLETKAVLGKFTYGKITRQVNHIVYLLDKLTVYERIAKDDTSVNFFLPKFTLPQIMDFIRIANENSAANVLSLLLEYKNAHFAEFDPMEEFTLNLL